MKNIILAALLLFPAALHAQYSVATSTGGVGRLSRSTMTLVGVEYIYTSTKTIDVASPAITLHGPNRRLTVRDGAAVSTVTANGFYGNFYGPLVGTADNLGNHIATTTVFLNVTPYLKMKHDGANYSAIQGNTMDGRFGLQMYDNELYDNTMPFQLGGYGPVLYGKGGLMGGTALGINNSAPAYMLDVTGGGHFTSSVTADAGIYGSVTGASSLNVLKAGDTMTGQLTIAGSSLTVGGNAFSVGASSFTVISGKVGVAGANVVIGSPYNTLGNLNVKADITGANYGGTISLSGDAGGGETNAPYIRLHGKKENSSPADTAGYLAIETGQSAAPYISEKVRINSLGRMGIGNVAPSQALDVTGNIATSGQVISSGTGTNYFAGQIHAAAATDATGAGLMLGYTTLYGSKLWQSTAGNIDTYFDQQQDSANNKLIFRTRTLGTPLTAMSIVGNGNITKGAPNFVSTFTYASGALSLSGPLTANSYGNAIALSSATAGASTMYLRSLSSSWDLLGPDGNAFLDFGKTGGLGIRVGANLAYGGINMFADATTGATSMLYGQNNSATGNLMKLNSAGNDRLIVTAAGLVGIGNVTPASFNASANNLVVGDGVTNDGITLYSATTGNGNLYFADGTASDAPYRGIISYEHTNDAFAFYTAGINERMRINSAGSVGIGTATPLPKLHVVGTIGTSNGDSQVLTSSITQTGIATFNGTVYSYDGANMKTYIGLISPGIGGLQTETDASAYAPLGLNGSDINMYIGSAKKAVIDASGNMGIGENTPRNRLHVTGTVNTPTGSTAQGMIQISTGTGAIIPVLQLGINSGNDGWIEAIHPGVGNRNLLLQQNGGSVSIGADTAPTALLEIKKMGVDHVGIGLKADTGGKWYVNAGVDGVNNGAFNIGQTATGANNSLLILPGGNTGLGNNAPTQRLELGNSDADTYIAMGGARGYVGYDSGGNAVRIQGTNKAIVFSTSGVLEAGEAMRIATGGNVGIGVTAPYNLLSIEGVSGYPGITVGESATKYANMQWSASGDRFDFNTYGYSYPVGLDGSVLQLQVNSGNAITAGGRIDLKTYTETKSSAAVSTTYDVSWSSGSVYWLSLNDNTTLTFSSAVEGQSLTFFIKQNVGSKAITWPTISWPSATAPTLTTTAGKLDIVTVVYTGGVYYGFLGGQNY